MNQLSGFVRSKRGFKNLKELFKDEAWRVKPKVNSEQSSSSSSWSDFNDPLLSKQWYLVSDTFKEELKSNERILWGIRDITHGSLSYIPLARNSTERQAILVNTCTWELFHLIYMCLATDLYNVPICGLVVYSVHLFGMSHQCKGGVYVYYTSGTVTMATS